jgi:hypothetical protein
MRCRERHVPSLGVVAHSVVVAIALSPLLATVAHGEAIPVDLTGYRDGSEIKVSHQNDRLFVRWPMESGEYGRLVLDLQQGRPLIETIGIATDAKDEGKALLASVEPVTFLTVGSRESPPDRPKEMSVFNVFFDSPAGRPHTTERVQFALKQARVVSHGQRVIVELDELTCGSFHGKLRITVYAGARLVQVGAVLATSDERRAIAYDTGLAGDMTSVKKFGWMDTDGRFQRVDNTSDTSARPVMVRHRTLVGETVHGSVACFPPPHQFFFPRDLTDNQSVVWFGKGFRGLEARPGIGVRQTETGGGAYVPWSNAPPKTDQGLSVFYLLSRGGAEDALRETLRYTRGDSYPELPGHIAFTSHWHMAMAVAAMNEIASGKPRTIPDSVRMFKEMGVKIVHLAEFHGDGHPQDPGPLRGPELEAMFAECRRLSDENLLLLPGEEANVHLGRSKPGRNPGHWLYLFPKPVYWTMRRAANEPFADEKPGIGTLYHVGDEEEMVRLLEREHGLAWTAHPRIKASNWAPDIYREEPFFRSPLWLGAAWKAMPADLSLPRLGTRSLDLLDDMANWGAHKYVLGEVDVFKIDHTHELFGHMNINYLRLDRLPRFDEGWQPVLDALRGGRFFVTTGEVLIRAFRVGGKESGETLTLESDTSPDLRVELDWTFPPRFLEVVSGDGEKVYRERIDLADERPFGRRTWTLTPDLRRRKWVRLEAWDVATNGAFTEPVWLQGRPTTR